ncbi:hypothetical protein [Ekhidna sp.]|uniref:hypothetical protein n=1 Tax=Ekhidna sp. TaxID=2608089 RepID=UPI00351434A2
MNRDTMDGKLLFAGNLLTNASSNTDIATALATFGYTTEKLDEGKALLDAARNLVDKQKQEYGEQFAATDAMNAAREVANGQYMMHLKIARIALKNDRGAEESLRLRGDRKDSFSGWLNQAKAFYANALASQSIIDAFGRFGITQEKLQAGQALVADAEQKLNEQLKEKGEAQQATLERDAALDSLNDYISDLVAISRIALEDKPQYLEMLGVKV